MVMFDVIKLVVRIVSAVIAENSKVIRMDLLHRSIYHKLDINRHGQPEQLQPIRLIHGPRLRRLREPW
jgi:hypothetical protein